jgi:hypothetical protein
MIRCFKGPRVLEGALLPQDSVDGLRATVWQVHKGQIRAWTEREVLLVYKQLSDICLSDILDKIEAEASIEEMTDEIRQEVAAEMRGKYLGLLAQEKTKAYEAALDEAQAEGLTKARAQGEAEAAQKGCTYKKLQLQRAEEEACLEVARIFKNCLQSAKDKMVHQVEKEVSKEHDIAIAEWRTALEVGLKNMEYDARVEHIRSLVVQYGLLEDASKGSVGEPKLPTLSPKSLTAPKAAVEVGLQLLEDSAYQEHVRFLELAASSKTPTLPHPEPSPCPMAGEDESTPKVAIVHMD